MYYSTVSLSSLAAERITYDMIEFSEISFGGRALDNNQKKSLYRIPYSEILNLLYDIKIINKEIKDNLYDINMTRNRYIHPTLEGEPEKDDLSTQLNKKNYTCFLSSPFSSVIVFIVSHFSHFASDKN
jgi:hypothetical protein